MALDIAPPQNLEAEVAVLGCMLLAPKAVARAIEILRPADFYVSLHRSIYEAMCDLAAAARPIDLITLPDELRRRKDFDESTGLLYLMNLMEAPSTAENVEFYARVVEEKATFRRLLDAALQIQVEASSAQEPVADVMARAEERIYGITADRHSASWSPILPLVEERLAKLQERIERGAGIQGLRTPFADLDYMLGGLQPSELVLLAARPGMGKTSCAMQIAQHAATAGGVTVAMFSLEMSREPIVDRAICSELRIDYHSFRTGNLLPDELERIGQARHAFEDAKLFIDDTRDCAISEVHARCRRLKSERGLGLVVIDYIQQIHASRRTASRVDEISDVVRGCKTIARDLKVPVLALAQLSREVERRPDKRPILADLRESGQLEAEADVVLMLYRDAYYQRDEESDPRAMQTVEIGIAKNRNGQTGRVNIGFLPHLMRFENLTRHWEDSAPAQPAKADSTPAKRGAAEPPAPASSMIDAFYDEGEEGVLDDPFATEELPEAYRQ